MLATAIVVMTTGLMNRTVAQNAPPPPPPNPSSPHPARPDLATTKPHPLPATRPLSPLAPGERRLDVQFEGGHDTDPRDHGRPVALIAAALGVPDNVFRETFTHVHPAGLNSNGPTDAEARQNKAALMAGLSPYGVTDDRINEVSNYYRYMRRKHDDLWQHRDALAYAVVDAKNKFLRFDLVDPGAGYTTPPKVTIKDKSDVTVTAKLLLGTDLDTNGSIESLVIVAPTTNVSR
jgi:hypothetical protein